MPFKSAEAPLLVVISGPSGVGKDAVLARMREIGHPAEYITTVTTRPKRPRERDKVDYRFVSSDMFQEMIQNNELLEWANVYGNWYGVPRQPVRRALGHGRDVILKVDIQGAATIRKVVPPAILIFLTPPSLEELVERLRWRQTESQFDLTLRIETAEVEMQQLSMFDYTVQNREGEIDRAVQEIQAIILAEKCRVIPREIAL